MVAYMDEAAGRIVHRIDAAGLAANTLVLFTGDNGTSPAITTQTKSGPYRGGKGSTVEAGTHVPLLARWQGVSLQGAVCEDLIDFTDFFPALAEAAGAPIPVNHPRDGRSFLPRLRGQKGDPRDWIFCDYNPRWGKFPPARWAMDKRCKLYGDGRFYDIQNDPGEQRPLQELTAEMRQAKKKLESVLSSMHA
jgi:arylsulfatase A-like enzyme